MSMFTNRRPVWLCLILLAALLLSACASSVDSPPQTDAPTEAETKPVSVPGYTAVETTSFAGEMTTKTVFAESYAEYGVTVLRENETVPAFAELGETLPLAEAERDAAFCAALEVTLTRELTDDMAGEIARRYDAGTSPDLLEFASAKTAAAQAPSGYLADLYSIDSFSVDHYAFDAHLTRALTVSERCYFLFGEATVGDVAATSVLLVDRAAAELAGYNLAEAADAVENGEWTVEILGRLIAEGRLSLGEEAVLPVFIGCGGVLFVKDEHDDPLLTIGDPFSRAYAAMQTLMTAHADPEIPDAEDVSIDPIVKLGTLGDVKAGITLLPVPCLSSGAPYRSAVNPARASCISVPVNPVDPHRTGHLLTVYFEESADTVGRLIRSQLTEDTDGRMLDQILSSRECLLGTLFGWGDLADALTASVGMDETEFLESAQMRMTAASRAMEIFLGRLK